MPGDSNPSRRLPLDDKKPKDFLASDGFWPSGPFVNPWTPEEMAQLGITDNQADIYVQAVARLGKTVIRYRNWLSDHRTTQAAFARRIGVSEGRLSALRNGTRFPSWDLVERVRVVVTPTRPPQQ